MDMPCASERYSPNRTISSLRLEEKVSKVLNNRTCRVKEVCFVSSVMGAPEDVMGSVLVFVSARTCQTLRKLGFEKVSMQC